MTRLHLFVFQLKVLYTLIEAVVLVFIVMFLFLQNWRATIIPTLAVPVVVLGTFAVINIFGFSINTLTMFAMVLAVVFWSMTPSLWSKTSNVL